jgi:hypothetical protein
VTRPAPKLTAKFQFWLSPEMLATLNAESVARDIAASDIVRDAIDFYLASTPPPSAAGRTEKGEGKNGSS